MDEPVLPIYIGESAGQDDVVGYGTVEEAQSHLEAVDVNAGEYVGWDADGRPLKLQAHTPTGTVRISLASEAPSRES